MVGPYLVAGQWEPPCWSFLGLPTSLDSPFLECIDGVECTSFLECIEGVECTPG